MICLVFTAIHGAIFGANSAILKHALSDSARIISLLKKAEKHITLSETEIDYLKGRKLVVFADVEYIPDSVGLLEGVQKISFYNTGIKLLPDAIGGLPNLEYLYLDGTNI